ncbi:thioesterase II family protein [Hyalangium versicolor]|uniref:thioesterase II family protein n=1 Tax=Hyalangium versicolor TaxID=2861190 RepID=UPI001CCAE532|nr:alpha/beta fold hydrolase [Hyalangium versicolor]
MSSPWLPFFSANASARVRLLCFPYAGGGASLYRSWSGLLPPTVEPCAVQLPGREERVEEPSLVAFPKLMAALEEALMPLLVERPFALFGHSMGALIAFEFARHLRRRGGPAPVYLFVSGARAPQLRGSGLMLHALPEPEFLAALQQLGADAAAILEVQEAREVWGRLMRADLQLAELYSPGPEAPLDCPVAAFGGLSDPTVAREELAAWREQTGQTFSLHMLPGQHLFVRSGASQITRLLWQKLRGVVPGL